MHPLYLYLCRMCLRGHTMCFDRTFVYLFASSLQNRAVGHQDFYSLFSVYLWNDLAEPVFDGVGLACFKSRANVFILPCGLGFRIQPTFAIVRVVRVD